MSEFATQLTTSLSLATIAAQILVVYLFVMYFGRNSKASGFLGRHAILFGFLFSAGAMGASLIYSNVIGFEACSLCWYQRIFLFPQVALFGLALWRKEKVIADYVLVLSIIGGIIAIYHYYGQMFNTGALPCAAESGGISPCAVRFFVEFGYITIPMMSLTTFLVVIALMLLHRKTKTT